MFLGEADNHLANIGIVNIDGKLYFVKIDHGSSIVRLFTDEGVLRQNFASLCKKWEYSTKWTIDPKLMKQAVDQMAENLSPIEDGMGNIVDHRREKIV